MELKDIDLMAEVKAEYLAAKSDYERLKSHTITRVEIGGKYYTVDVLMNQLHPIALQWAESRLNLAKTKLMQFGVTEFP